MTTPSLSTSSSLTQPDVDRLAIDTLRFLSVDQVQSANSGHPGLPLGAAPLAWALFSRHLRFDSADPDWPDRDRFVLSAGHGSALLYALLHVFGYDVTADDLAGFRQLGSRTPGHPEFGHTAGVETTTGPLGQGFANAVGMALAEQLLASRFPNLTHHRTFALVGDGCLMEGISHEAASMAGRLNLGRLIVLFDDNDITIDGTATSSCADDQLARFAAYGWHVAQVTDGADLDAIDEAIRAAVAEHSRPSFIAVRTTIGAGAPGIEGTPKAHGSPLGVDVIAGMKAAAGWQHPPFAIPDEVVDAARRIGERGAALRLAWEQRLAALATADPRRAAQWRRVQAGEPPAEVDGALTSVPTGSTRATRQASQEVLTAVAAVMPELAGGSADLAGSTGTETGQAYFPDGPRIRFGVREHAMAAVMNGMALHGGVRPYGSTFLVFSDYLRPALRLSALMRQPVIYVFTHDSISVGEDGPTHQPVEQLEALRLIPGVRVFRPADDFETVAAWRAALEHRDGPSVLILTRQAVEPLPRDASTTTEFLAEFGGRAIVAQHATAAVDLDLLASGSEVGTAVAAAALLAERGIHARVFSVPWRERFAEQRHRLATAASSVSLEAGSTRGWAGLADLTIGLDEFGASGPGENVVEQFGLTATAVAARIDQWFKERR